ncbi:carbohydrate ABC transporter permease [Paenibacillus sp.]|uniref:carbohydrate ABC transporter permease n=1 Tax=Paenibacillus sp. TaxID=58172 RepID=UPI002810C32F|nr:carbohydrate ABC transporter permease [Paenibacillus sp.]
MSARSRSDRWFDAANYCILTLLLAAVLYPLYFVVIASVSDPDLVNAGRVWLYPREMTLEGYERIFGDDAVWYGYRNSLLYTVVGTAINVTLTLTGGYALSRRDLPGRTVFTFAIVFTMFFGGGLIPTYLLVKELGMVNTMWAMVVPNAVSAFNIVVARTFFQSTIPKELLEAAAVDGCPNTLFFLRIALPLSMPIVAVLTLFSAVGHWNSYFQALIYLNRDELMPLQIVLRNLLIASEVSDVMTSDMASSADQQRIVEVMKFGMIVVASLPMLALYPFLQKYFVKGVMIGSLKG